MNIKTILCPTDFSSSSDVALAYASFLAANLNASLYIVHVDEGAPRFVPGYSGYGLIPEMEDPREAQERERLNHVVPPDRGVEFQHRFIVGNADKEIVNFAEREDVDLIVMGTHGRTGLPRVLMGSVAEGVIRHASCPVLTVKAPAEECERATAIKQQQGTTC